MHPVIRNISIKNFRGFRDFRLEGLTDLTILTGRNGCGKSTVLDALHIANASNCAEAVGQVVNRHLLTKNGARWLFGDPSQVAEFESQNETERRLRRLELSESIRHQDDHSRRAESTLLEPGERITSLTRVNSFDQVELARGSHRATTFSLTGVTTFNIEGDFIAERIGTQNYSGGQTAIIDPSVTKELSKLFSRAVQQGSRTRLQDLLRSVVPDLQSIQVLTEDDNSSRLYLEWPKRAIPLSLSGDGIAALLQIAIEAVVVDKGGLILVEEPEVFLHPRAISVVASLLLELMKEGRQVVITTHSLELIDSLLGWSAAEDRDQMSLFNLRPAEGAPQVVRWSGSKMDLVRSQVMDDLR